MNVEIRAKAKRLVDESIRHVSLRDRALIASSYQWMVQQKYEELMATTDERLKEQAWDDLAGSVT